MASGYKLIIGILTIIVVSFLWIVFNYTIGIAGAAINSLTTDADVIARNNIIITAFYWALLIIIIAVIIYIIKPDKGEQEAGEVVYVPGY